MSTADSMDTAPVPVRGRVLVIDDDPSFRRVVTALLANAGFAVAEAPSGADGLGALARLDPDVILLDLQLPDSSGQDVLRRIRQDPRTRLVPVIMLTGAATADQKLLALENGVTDFLAKPFDPRELLTRVGSLVELKSFTDALEDAERVVIALARTIDARDPYTAGHSERVSYYCGLLGERIGLSREDQRTLRQGALFHDIGKVAIPDRILLKEGRLTPGEYAEMQRHPVTGAELLRHMKTLSRALPIVLHHHERMDGSGYPAGLSGDQIPVLARATSVADVFDALTTTRPYRPSFTTGQALELLAEEARRGWWDPAMVAALGAVARGLGDRPAEAFRAGSADPETGFLSTSWPERLARVLLPGERPGRPGRNRPGRPEEDRNLRLF